MKQAPQATEQLPVRALRQRETHKVTLRQRFSNTVRVPTPILAERVGGRGRVSGVRAAARRAG